MRYRSFFSIAIFFLTASAAAQPVGYSITPAFPLLSNFDRPVDVQFAPGHLDKLFLVEQPGRIRIIENDPASAAVSTLLDIRDRVFLGWEEGLLGLAFDPSFDENGHLYVYYNAPGTIPGAPHRSVLSRFTVPPREPMMADPSSEEILLEVDQPGDTHNGGQVRFGPDGYLYASFGDGMWGGDPFGNGQDPSNLLGSIIRIDVSEAAVRSDSSTAYAIPDSNPFVGKRGYRPEIWAYGLRNPWRFSFDSVRGDLWVGDVGEGWIEEVNLVVEGGNYGWSTMAGSTCYNDPPDGALPCHHDDLLLPVFEYTHANGDKSVTGGFVYRGLAHPELYGKYVFGDFVSGRIWALTLDWSDETSRDIAVSRETLVESGLLITSFGVDAEGELLVLSYTGGIYHIASAVTAGDAPPSPRAGSLRLAGPNPARVSTVLELTAVAAGYHAVDLVDSSGRRVSVLREESLPQGATLGITVDSGSLAAGVYLARLLVNGAPAAVVPLTVVR